MKKALLVLVAVLAGSAFADWTSLGPEGGPIYTGVISSGSTPVVYAAPQISPAPLVRSTDQGATWSAASGSLFSYPYAMVADPNDPNTLYGVISNVCVRTSDQGATWSQYSIGNNVYIQALAMNPQNSQVLYGAGYAYDGTAWHPCAARSENAGQNWVLVNTDTASNAYNYAVAVDPVDTTIVYCGGYTASGLSFFKSTDRGDTWTRYELPGTPYYLYSLYVNPLDHNVVLAGTLYGIYRSTDGGVNWTQRSSFYYNYVLAVSPAEPNIIYTCSDTTVYRSDDTGKTWTQPGGGIHGTISHCLLADPVAHGVVYYGTTTGMYRTADYGAHWAEANHGIVVGKIPVITIDPEDAQSAMIEFAGNAVFQTTNRGDSWTRCPDFLSCGNICGIAIDPRTRPRTVWALEGSG